MRGSPGRQALPCRHQRMRCVLLIRLSLSSQQRIQRVPRRRIAGAPSQMNRLVAACLNPVGPRQLYPGASSKTGAQAAPVLRTYALRRPPRTAARGFPASGADGLMLDGRPTSATGARACGAAALPGSFGSHGAAGSCRVRPRAGDSDGRHDPWRMTDDASPNVLRVGASNCGRSRRCFCVRRGDLAGEA